MFATYRLKISYIIYSIFIKCNWVVTRWQWLFYMYTKYQIGYLLTPRCRVLLENLPGLQLVKKFPAFHGTRKFITALTSVRQLSLSWASPIQSIYPHPTSWEIHPNIDYPSTPGSPQLSLSFRFPQQHPIYSLAHYQYLLKDKGVSTLAFSICISHNLSTLLSFS